MKGLVEQSTGPFAISTWARNTPEFGGQMTQADWQLACGYARPWKAIVLVASIG